MTKTQRDWLMGTALSLLSIVVGLWAGLSLPGAIAFGWLILLGISPIIVVPVLLLIVAHEKWRSWRRARP